MINNRFHIGVQYQLQRSPHIFVGCVYIDDEISYLFWSIEDTKLKILSDWYIQQIILKRHSVFKYDSLTISHFRNNNSVMTPNNKLNYQGKLRFNQNEVISYNDSEGNWWSRDKLSFVFNINPIAEIPQSVFDGIERIIHFRFMQNKLPSISFDVRIDLFQTIVKNISYG